MLVFKNLNLVLHLNKRILKNIYKIEVTHFQSDH